MNLKEIRKALSVSQSELARKIGVSQGAVSMWEKGRRVPKVTDFPKIAAALNVPVEQVLECFIKKTEKEEA